VCPEAGKSWFDTLSTCGQRGVKCCSLPPRICECRHFLNRRLGLPVYCFQFPEESTDRMHVGRPVVELSPFLFY